jgi:hypothetical protein
MKNRINNRIKIIVILVLFFQNCVSKNESAGRRFDKLGDEAPHMDAYDDLIINNLKAKNEYFDSLNEVKQH